MCDHQTIALTQVLPSLGVAKELLDHAYTRCYCTQCEPTPRKRRDGQGGIPVGYTRIGVSVDSIGRGQARGIFSWPKTFHGTTPTAIPGIVQSGHLVMPGDTLSSGVTLQIRDGHITKSGIERDITLDAVRSGRAGIVSEIAVHGAKLTEKFSPTQCVFMSPTHAYAQSPVYASQLPFARGQKKATVLLEIRMEPGTFDVGPHTLNERNLTAVMNECTPHCVDPSQMEWYTNRYGAHVVTGILIRVESLRGLEVDHSKAVSMLPKPDALPNAAALLLQSTKLLTPKESFMKCPVAAERFSVLLSLGLSPLFFSMPNNFCYCPSCEKDTGGKYTRAGKTYRLPYGYTRVALSVDGQRAATEDIWDSFPVAYHGTTLGALHSIIKSGGLLPTGCYDASGNTIASRDAKKMREERSSTATANLSRIYCSPVLGYAAHPVHATWSPVSLPGGRTILASVALQLRVRPGFAEGPGTVKGFTVSEAEKEYKNSLEWSTNRQNSVIVYGVLIKTKDA